MTRPLHGFRELHTLLICFAISSSEAMIGFCAVNVLHRCNHWMLGVNVNSLSTLSTPRTLVAEIPLWKQFLVTSEKDITGFCEVVLREREQGMVRRYRTRPSRAVMIPRSANNQVLGTT